MAINSEIVKTYFNLISAVIRTLLDVSTSTHQYTLRRYWKITSAYGRILLTLRTS